MSEFYLNGEKKLLQENLTLQQLVSELNFVKNTFAVAINNELISRAQYSEIIIQKNDIVEIVTAMQGG